MLSEATTRLDRVRLVLLQQFAVFWLLANLAGCVRGGECLRHPQLRGWVPRWVW